MDINNQALLCLAQAEKLCQESTETFTEQQQLAFAALLLVEQTSISQPEAARIIVNQWCEQKALGNSDCFIDVSASTAHQVTASIKGHRLVFPLASLLHAPHIRLH